MTCSERFDDETSVASGAPGVHGLDNTKDRDMTEGQQSPKQVHPRVEGEWFHGRPEEGVAFDADRPAFFASERDGVELFAGEEGFVTTVRIKSIKPASEQVLLELADELGLPDVYGEDFTDFPDVSSHLERPEMRRRLDELGYDSYVGEDGYLYVAVVWNPSLIDVVSLDRFNDVASALR